MFKEDDGWIIRNNQETDELLKHEDMGKIYKGSIKKKMLGIEMKFYNEEKQPILK